MSAEVNSENAQLLEVEVLGKELVFSVDRDDYNKFVNKSTQHNKVAPCHNFLMSTIQSDYKQDLREILDSCAGSEVEIAGAIIEAYSPDLGIVVKKRNQ